MDTSLLSDVPSLRTLFSDRDWPKGPAIPAAALRDRVVLVTGAGGSLGSTLVQRLCQTDVRALIAVDTGEHQLVRLQSALDDTVPPSDRPPVRFVLADLRHASDRQRSLRAAPDGATPDVAIHTAAYKHVPFLEGRPLPAATNNVLATVDWAEACREAGVNRIVFVSTDKAATPTSVMGQTKRWAEEWLRSVFPKATPTDAAPTVATARLCNLFGSRGSVVPFFMRRLRADKPVPVTHPSMRRWMMTADDGGRSILGAAGASPGTYVPDACLNVRIPALARRLIQWARPSATPADWIEWTEPRPGEHLHEARWGPEETPRECSASALRRLDQPAPSPAVRTKLPALRRACRAGDAETVRALLCDVVPIHDEAPPSAAAPTATNGSTKTEDPSRGAS